MREDLLRAFLRDVRRLCPDMPVLEGEPMSRHTSFRIGGPCDAMLLPAGEEEIETVCRLLRQGDEKPFLLGNGTNLLVTDGPFRRVVIRLGERFADLDRRDTAVTARAGATLAQLAVFAARAGLGGLAFAHGIPGTVGGGVSMNAGAYGGELKDVLRSVRFLEEDLSLRERPAEGFSYRRSPFTDTDRVILSAEFALAEADRAAVEEEMRALMSRRRASQPLDLPSAGSTFKRPAAGYAAALIDQAGLKGFAVGGAQVSEKHAGFVVNRGGASFGDVLALMDAVRARVLDAFGVELEPEVRILR